MDVTANGLVRPVSIDRGDGRNNIDDAMVADLHSALDAAQQDPDCRVVLLSAAAGTFSTGMNLVAAGSAPDTDPRAAAERAGGAFFDLLDRIGSLPRIVVSAVDGTVAGGGVGLVAAGDLVYATGRSAFSLPEALWGLLPCCVLPFLARRVGTQRAYTMALTTQPVTAADAVTAGLVDAIAEDPARPVARLAYRSGKLDPDTITALKRYRHQLDPPLDIVRKLAVDELGRLMALPAVRQRMADFAEHRRFPWEN